MKKIMIAAAAAAMIVGAEAAQEADFVGSAGVIVYDVTLSLKTTKGAAAKKGAKQTVNLGWDGISTFWYQDAEMNGGTLAPDPNKIKWSDDFVPGTKVKWSELQGSKKLSGRQIPALDKNVVKKLKEADKIALGEVLQSIESSYSKRSAGQWCDTYTFTPEGLCYRNTGSVKVQGLYVGDCCSAGTGTFLGDLLTYRFGAMNSEKATKVEYLGEIEVIPAYLVDQKGKETKYVQIKDSAGQFGQPYVFAAAGQGTFGKVTVKVSGFSGSFDVIKTLSGNVVGLLPNTDCEYCCSLPIDAVCFDVCYTTLWSDATRYNGPEPGEPLSNGTAAFGTFTLKVNQTETNRYFVGDPKSIAFINGL